MSKPKERPQVVKTSFYAPAEIHRQAKIRAARDGVALTDVLLRALAEYLKRAGR